MTPDRDYRWLRIAGFATLALAGLMLGVAINQHAQEQRARRDIGLRAEEMMNRIEAEAQRMENAARQP